MKKEIDVLIPEYLKAFKCIGSDCEDTCCAGWRVNLDKKTYLKYKKSSNNELKPLFKKYVRRKHNNKTDSSYGTIVMKENGDCPFLNESRLCNIQLEEGSGYLSDICSFYPRTINKIDGKLEESASISCPEVARLLLFNENGVIFEQSSLGIDERVKVNIIFDTEGHLYYNKAERYFWDIRMFSLNVLQSRQYSIPERLMLLGIVYKKIQNLELEKKVHDIPLMLEAMSQLIEDGSLKEELENVPTNTQIQMMLAKEMADKKFSIGVSDERYIECFKETLLGLNYVKGNSIDNRALKYDENYKKYYKSYVGEKEYILENHLVNEYFRTLMPFGNYETIWDSYMFLCIIYSMVKLHMIGVSGYKKELNDEIVLKIIQSFSKAIMHNNFYIREIVNLLKSNNFDSLAYMAILVKN